MNLHTVISIFTGQLLDRFSSIELLKHFKRKHIKLVSTHTPNEPIPNELRTHKTLSER